MRRRRFFIGCAALAAAALTDVGTTSAADDDGLLDRLRRADFGTTPFSRVPDEIESGAGGIWTHRAIAQLKAGSPVKQQARMHAANHFRADLYALGVAASAAVSGERGEPSLSLLVVRRGDELTDIAGAIARPKVPDGGFADMMKVFQPNIVLGMPWTAAVMSAIELAVKAAWPEHDTRIGASSGGGPGAASYVAIKSTVADWTQTSPARRDQILDAIGSVAGRVYGLTRPNSNAGSATIVVGIEAADDVTAPSARVLRTSAGNYLASKIATATRWQSNDS